MSGPIKQSDYDTDHPHLRALRAAIAVHDAGELQRDLMLETALSDADVVAWQRACADALVPVQEEFWKLTKEYNSRKNCALVDIHFLKRMAREGLR